MRSEADVAVSGPSLFGHRVILAIHPFNSI